MSVYTRVTRQQLSAWLERYPVGRLRVLRGIAEGIENSNYLVETDRGRYVLTLFERIPAAELSFYLDLMAHLAREGVPCAAPEADNAGAILGELNGKPAALVAFLPGRPILEPSMEHCSQVGGMLAELHLRAASFGRTLENSRGPRWWRATADALAGRLAPEDAVLLREELRFQSLFRFPDLPRGIVHADLFRDNVLWQDGRVSGVLDFYFACTDVLLYDIAVTANDWCVLPDGGLDTGRTRALLAGYHARRALTAIERGAWPVLLRAGALRFWLSRLQDSLAPRSGELTYTKDPGEFRNILVHRAEDHARLNRLWV